MIRRRLFIGLIALGLLAVAPVAAAPTVLGPDDRPVDNATVIADAGAYWVGRGAALPVLLTPGGDKGLRLPELAAARLLILDAATGTPITRGELHWRDPAIPESLATVDWNARRGRLNIGCRGGEAVVIGAAGYRPAELELKTGNGRRTVLLEPRGDLTLRLEPAAAGTLWLASEDSLSVFSPFHAAAAKHAIGDDGLLEVPDLDGAATHIGVVVIPGRAPVVGRLEGLPLDLELAPGPGLGVVGRVVDNRGRPISRARVTATGRIEELGGFRYRHQVHSDDEGRFTVTGLIDGEITVAACAEGRVCTERTVTLSADTESKPVRLRLAPGHDLRLVVHDGYGRPAAGATVIDNAKWRRHTTDENGVLVFEGVRPGRELDLRISGAGLRPWEGRVDTSQREVVLRIATGGIVEWPILTHRELAADEIIATWSRLNTQGREIAEGFAEWLPEHAAVRAEGLDAGRHRLVVRLPGAATMTSDVVEVELGDELLLPAAIPDRGMAIGGRVLDGETLQPVAGARICCEPGSPHQFRKPHRLERLQQTISNADGTFLLEGLDAGRCRTIVRAPGFAAWRRDGVEPDLAGADLGDIELDHGMTVVGRVVDRSDRPQAGITVEIIEDAVYAYLAEASLRTDHDGWFRAEALPVGSWALEARRGEHTARTVIDGRAGETVQTELRLGGMRLEGEVWIGNRPAGGGHLVLATAAARGDGIVVMVRADADQRRLYGVDQPPVTITVAGDGRFVADGIEPGVYTASYTPDGGGASPVSRELVVPRTEVHRCLLQFADAGLEGIVIDADGRTVAGAAVYVLTADNGPAANGFSDGDGAFAFVGLDPGEVRVAAIHGELGESTPRAIELRSGVQTGPVTIELEPTDGAELGLRVISAGGSLSGAPVYLVGAETLTGFTDDVGTASFTGIEAGHYRPCAAAYGGAVGCGVELDLAAGDRRQATLALGSGGFIDVRVGPMERVPGLRVLTADGIDLTSMLMMVSPPLPGPDGIRIGPLKTDDYRITVAMAEGPRQGGVATIEGEIVELDLR